MFVCPTIGMWRRANGNPNPCTHLDEILHTSPHYPRPLPPLGLGGPETLKAEEHIFENCLQSKGCSAGYKLIQAALGTSAS